MTIRRYLLALLAIGACGLPASATDEFSFKGRDGREYTNVFVTKVMGRKVEIMTSSGLQIVHMIDLPPEVQKRHIDPNAKPPPKVGDKIEFTTIEGKAVKGRIHRIAPDGLTLETSDGFDKVAYSQLPKEYSDSFDYDADDAARHAAANRAQQQALFEKIAAEQQVTMQKAAEEKAAADAAAAAVAAQAAQNAQNRADRMGDRGSKNLGSPRLGGRGLDK